MYHPVKKRDAPVIFQESLRVPDGDVETVAQKRKILSWLSLATASYVAEIAWESSLSEYQCKTLLNLLFRDGLIEGVRVDFHSPDIRLMARVADQSAQGQGGFENFSRKHWFAITHAGWCWLDTSV